MAGPQPMGLGLELFKFIVFKDPNWDYRTFNFDSDMALTAKADNGVMNALDPNLKPFLARGGKIIQYHGWADPQISPLSSVRYYNTVLDTLGGASKVTDSYRLFMVPGMAHCGGGEGTSNFDMLTRGRAVGGGEEGARSDSGIAHTRRQGGPDAASVPLPAGGEVQGHRQYRRRGNFACKLP